MKTEYLKDGKVVALRPVRARALFPALGRLETYWEGLRNGRVMPARAEIDPRGIADVLEFSFVLEKIAPGLARIRLAGMHINELMAMEVRGMPVTALFLPEARREFQRVLENVLEMPAAVRLTLGSDSGYARPALEAQMLLLPLRDAQGKVTRVLGALQAHGEIGRGPRRFLIRDVETKVLSGDPVIRPRIDDRGLARLATPRPATMPVAPRRIDAFAPRTAEMAREIARRRGTTEPEKSAGDASAPVRGGGRTFAHLRLVHDTDLV